MRLKFRAREFFGRIIFASLNAFLNDTVGNLPRREISPQTRMILLSKVKG